jgi:segregation and condensation protein A
MPSMTQWECRLGTMSFKPVLSVPDTADKSVKELLDLAEKKKLDLENLPVSEVTGQYLDYIKTNKVDADELSEFLVLAAKLLSLKVRELLPSPEQDLLEEEEEEDIAQELARHLMEYRTFKEAAGLFKQRFEEEPKAYARPNDLQNYVNSVSTSTYLEGLCLEDLLSALDTIMHREPEIKEQPAFELPRQEFNVRDKIKVVSGIVAERGETGITFDRLFPPHAQKAEIIVTFLALLELVRLGKVKIFQEHTFGTIIVQSRTLG